MVFRMADDLAGDLERYAADTGRLRSEILREALRVYLRDAARPPQKAADRVSHLIGSLETGRPDLARNTRKYVLESLRRGR